MRRAMPHLREEFSMKQHCVARARTWSFLCIVLSTFLVTQAVASEIFKCVAKDGTPLYQNFPCHLDSLGWLPPSPIIGKTPSMPGVVGQDKSKPQPVNGTKTGPDSTTKTKRVNAASTVNSSYTSEPSIGMTADEIRALLGEPEEMVDDEPAEGGRVSVWRYADGRIVQFDHKHHVFG